MKITILGTGCIWTKRACAGFLIDDDILIDPGSGILKQLLKSSNTLLHHEKIDKIKLILITHFHMDHYFDIAYFMWKLADKNKDLHATVICPSGGEKKIRSLCRLGMSKDSYRGIDFSNHITFVDASSMGTFKYRNFEITSKKMEHGSIDCYGYLISEKKGKRVFFSGDTTMCRALNYMIENSDIAFIDMAGTDISDKHFNIIDGIKLMKEKRGKCCIVPSHLTSQALDYCQGRINPPRDLMVIDTSDRIPYNYVLKKTPKAKIPKKFKFASKKFKRIEGELVDLVLSKTKEASASYKVPTYFYDILIHGKREIIGSMTYSVVPNNIDGHADNVSFSLKEEYNMMSIKYECYMLIKKVAKYHKAKLLYLTCAPDDFSTRKVFEILKATLKEISTNATIDKNNVRHLSEQCVWIWNL